MELLTIKGLRGETTPLLDNQALFHEVVRAVEKERSRAGGSFHDSQVIPHYLRTGLLFRSADLRRPLPVWHVEMDDNR